MGIPTLLKRVDSIGSTITKLGINRMNADEVDEISGKLNFNSKSQL